jgi:hypothetical protein
MIACQVIFAGCLLDPTQKSRRAASLAFGPPTAIARRSEPLRSSKNAAAVKVQGSNYLLGAGTYTLSTGILSSTYLEDHPLGDLQACVIFSVVFAADQ